MGSSKEGPIRSAPAFTLTGRTKPSAFSFAVPGPGSYDGDYQAIRKKPPQYSMGIKHRVPPDDNPGPGAHCPEKVSILKAHAIHDLMVTAFKCHITRKSVPAQTFRILHTPALGVTAVHHENSVQCNTWRDSVFKNLENCPGIQI